MRVSVAMPTYNRGYILADAIKSVLAQTFRDWELVIVDDGSRDNTQEVVSHFQDSRLRYLRHEANRGYSAACNTGMSAARGDLIAFLDSDDFWEPDKLERSVQFLDTNSAVVAVFTDTKKHDGRNSFSSSVRADCPQTTEHIRSQGFPQTTVLAQPAAYALFLEELPVKMPSLMIRRDAAKIAGGGFREDWSSASDWEFLLRLARQGSFGYIDLPLTTVRIQADSTHNLHCVEDKVRLIGMIKEEVARIPSNTSALAAARRGLASCYRHLGWYYLGQGKRLKASQNYACALRETGSVEFLARALVACLPEAIASALSRATFRPHAEAETRTRGKTGTP